MASVEYAVEYVLKAIASATNRRLEEVRKEFEEFKKKYPMKLKDETLAIIFARKNGVTIPVKAELLTEKPVPVKELKVGMVAVVEGVLLWKQENPKFGTVHFVVADATGAVYGKASQRYAEMIKNLPLDASVRIKGEVKPYSEVEEESPVFIHVYGINASVSLASKIIDSDAVYQKQPTLKRLPGDVVAAIAVPIEVTKFSYFKCRACRKKVNPQEYDSAGQCPLCGATDGYEEVEVADVTLVFEGDIMINAIAPSDSLIGDMSLFEGYEPIKVVMVYDSWWQRYRILRVSPVGGAVTMKTQVSTAVAEAQVREVEAKPVEVEKREAPKVEAKPRVEERAKPKVEKTEKKRESKAHAKPQKPQVQKLVKTEAKEVKPAAPAKPSEEKKPEVKVEVDEKLKQRALRLMKIMGKPLEKGELVKLVSEVITKGDEATAQKIIDALIAEGKFKVEDGKVSLA